MILLASVHKVLDYNPLTPSMMRLMMAESTEMFCRRQSGQLCLKSAVPEPFPRGLPYCRCCGCCCWLDSPQSSLWAVVPLLCAPICLSEVQTGWYWKHRRNQTWSLRCSQASPDEKALNGGGRWLCHPLPELCLPVFVPLDCGTLLLPIFISILQMFVQQLWWQPSLEVKN